MNITPAYLDNKVAYSLTYNQDVLPSGYLQYHEYFVKEYITTILLNGYPYMSYEEMGLNDENEAYTATQLAVYEMISRRDIADVTSGYVGINDITTNNEEYKEKLQRIKVVANSLVSKALDETYENYYDNGLEDLDYTTYIYDEEKKEGILGPFKTYVSYNDQIKKVIGNDSLDITRFEIINHIKEHSNICILDKDMKEVDSINTGEIFYFKISGENKYCANVLMYKDARFFASDVYKNNTSKNKYVILDTYIASYKDIYSMSRNVDTGKLSVSFVDREGNILSRAKFYILNEQKEKIIDISGFDMKTIKLPLGKYYVVEYYAPDGYFLNSNEYEVDITKIDEIKEIKIMQDSIL